LVGKVYSCGSHLLQVNIENFVVENKANQSAVACAKAANISDVPTWTNNPRTAMWHECPTPDYGQLTFTENVFIALYVFYGACFFTVIAWTVYKKTVESVSR
jgi:cation-transporting ATPase 13A3/4/5